MKGLRRKMRYEAEARREIRDAHSQKIGRYPHLVPKPATLKPRLRKSKTQ